MKIICIDLSMEDSRQFNFRLGQDAENEKTINIFRSQSVFHLTDVSDAILSQSVFFFQVSLDHNSMILCHQFDPWTKLIDCSYRNFQSQPTLFFLIANPFASGHKNNYTIG